MYIQINESVNKFVHYTYTFLYYKSFFTFIILYFLKCMDIVA